MTPQDFLKKIPGALRRRLHPLRMRLTPTNVAFGFYYFLCQLRYFFTRPALATRNLFSPRRRHLYRHGYLLPEAQASADSVQAFQHAFSESLATPGPNWPIFVDAANAPANTRVVNYPKEYVEQVTHLHFPRARLKATIDPQKWLESNYGDLIRECFGSYFHIENMWIYRTNNTGQTTYNLNSQWHKDSDPRSYLKFIVYLCDVNEKNGPFGYEDEVTRQRKHLLGPAGKAILFRSSELLHCAENTIAGERLAISFLLAPSIFSQSEYQDWPLNIYRRHNPFRRRHGFA